MGWGFWGFQCIALDEELGAAGGKRGRGEERVWIGVSGWGL